MELKTILGIKIEDEGLEAVETSSNSGYKQNLQVSLFENITLKNVDVSVIPKTKVIPLGNIAGVKLYTNGVLVVGMSEIEGIDNKKYKPYENTGIKEGDTIVKINNVQINSTDELIENVNKSNGKNIKINYIHEQETKECSIIPVETNKSEYKLGLWVRDSAAGVGTLDTIEDWDCEARRYYFNIVGKYGIQVQTLLKKVMNLDIEKICPLHGPILKENLEHYIEKYNIWSSYKTENEGVYIACASIHGNTYSACEKLKEILEEKGERNVVLVDLSKEDWSEAVEDAFRYGKVVFASSTYNMEIFTPMRNLLLNLKEKNYQNKIVGLIENGTWAPNSAKCMKEILSTMKNIDIIEPVVTIKSRLSKENCLQLFEMADDLIKK